MKLRPNSLKRGLQRGDVQYGIWLSTGSATCAEIAGNVGFDWCLIDGEHAANTLTETVPQLHALELSGTPAVMRVASADDWMIKHALDQGVQTIVVPMVDTADQAQKMARAMRYPPDGARGMGATLARASGFGNVADYVHQANAEVCLLVQAESRQAYENIDAIAATEGVDGVFIGPADLSADMGYPGQPDHPDVAKAIAYMIERITVAGKFVGTVTFDPQACAEYVKMGVTFLGIGGDALVLNHALKALLAEVKAS